MMQSLFDKKAYEEILERINTLTPETQRKWGKMDVAQMLAHCIQGVKMPLDHQKYPRVFIGYIFGSYFKKTATNDVPYKQSLPTDKSFLITDSRNFDKEKQELLSFIDRFHKGGEKAMTPHPHPFFGKMTPQQWGISQYKHLDHHLKQFGA